MFWSVNKMIVNIIWPILIDQNQPLIDLEWRFVNVGRDSKSYSFCNGNYNLFLGRLKKTILIGIRNERSMFDLNSNRIPVSFRRSKRPEKNSGWCCRFSGHFVGETYILGRRGGVTNWNELKINPDFSVVSPTNWFKSRINDFDLFTSDQY